MERESPSLRQRLHGAAQRSGLLAFWHWWRGQLATLMPAGLSTAVRRRRLRPIIAFDSDAAVVWAPRVVEGTLGFAELARVSLTGDPAEIARAGRAAIDALPRIAHGGAVAETRVALSLPASQVLRKTITLPAAVEENLRQTLAYDLDRLTPFKPDEVYFDAVVFGRDPAKKEIRVDWAAALRGAVDQARRRAESWGAAVVAVTPQLPTEAAALSAAALNLLPVDERSDESMWRRWQVWVPLALIGILALVAVALPLWQKRGYVIELAQLADQARVRADASSALREELDRLTGDYNFALQRKYVFPAALQVLEDVTKLLPDDTWITQLELKTTARGKDPRREIVLRGESANAGSLVSLLEGSKVFEQAAPRSPTTKIQPGPGEIFDLGAQLKTQPMPPLIQLAAATGVPVRPARPAGAPTPPPAAATEPGAGVPDARATAPEGAAPAGAPGAGTAPVGAPATAAGRAAVPVAGAPATNAAGGPPANAAAPPPANAAAPPPANAPAPPPANAARPAPANAAPAAPANATVAPSANPAAAPGANVAPDAAGTPPGAAEPEPPDAEAVPVPPPPGTPSGALRAPRGRAGRSKG